MAKEFAGGAAAGLDCRGVGSGHRRGRRDLPALEASDAQSFGLHAARALIAPAIALLALRAPAPMIAAAQAIGGVGMGISARSGRRRCSSTSRRSRSRV